MTPHELLMLLEVLKMLSGHPGDSTATANPPQHTEAAPSVEPKSIAEVAEIVLHCYHPSGRFQTVDVVERPWSRQGEWNAEASVLLQIHWHDLVNPAGEQELCARQVGYDQAKGGRLSRLLLAHMRTYEHGPVLVSPIIRRHLAANLLDRSNNKGCS